MFSLISSKIVNFHLSLKTRSNLVQKLKTSNLVNLPNEILGEIISGLDIVDLLALCKSNIHLENLCSDEYFLMKVQYKYSILDYIKKEQLKAALFNLKYGEVELDNIIVKDAIYEIFIKLDNPNVYNNQYNDVLNLINIILEYSSLRAILSKMFNTSIFRIILLQLLNNNKIHPPYYSYQFMINKGFLSVEDSVVVLINEEEYINFNDPNRQKILQIALSYPINIDKLIDAIKNQLFFKLKPNTLKFIDTFTKYFIPTYSKYLVLKYILERIHVSTDNFIAMYVISYFYLNDTHIKLEERYNYIKDAAFEIFNLLNHYILDDYRFSEIDMVTIINHIFTYNINGLSILNDLTKYFNIINNNILIKYIVDKILSYIKYSFINIIDLEEKFAILKKLKFDEEVLRAVTTNSISFTNTDDIQCPPELCNIEFILSLFGIYE